jgi:hypothetical protein
VNNRSLVTSTDYNEQRRVFCIHLTVPEPKAVHRERIVRAVGGDELEKLVRRGLRRV